MISFHEIMAFFHRPLRKQASQGPTKKACQQNTDRLSSVLVGVRGFEPPTSSSRTTRANRAALHPEIQDAKVMDFNYICFMSNREKIIKKILRLSDTIYPGVEIYLYGSQARGDADFKSDWDLLVLLNSSEIPVSTEKSLMDEFYKIELETGAVISPLIYPKNDWFNKYRITPLFENIERESIRLK
jgi:uncharacterized protein